MGRRVSDPPTDNISRLRGMVCQKKLTHPTRSTYAGGKGEVKVQPQIGAGAAAYVDVFNFSYKAEDKNDGK